MPLYEYKCKTCGDVFEVLQKFSDEPVSVHAECGGDVDRLISPSAFHFKGTGWYVTDYGRSKGANGKGQAKDKDGKTETKSETKSEPKPAAEPAKTEKPAATKA